MSLLINALKKYRQNSALPHTQSVSDASLATKPRKYKKILFTSFIFCIIVLLTFMVSFLVFKQVIKKHVLHEMTGKVSNIQAQVKDKVIEKASSVSSDQATEGTSAIRARLQQKVQQQRNASSVTNTASNDLTSASNNSAAAASDFSAPLQSRGIKHRQIHRRPNNDQNESISQDATPVSTANDIESTAEPQVEIKAVTNDIGKNNSTYQKAIGFVQHQQYHQALALLIENDELLFKTKGLSALLMARIYLATGEYVLAEDALEHALLLHPGSELALLELKAQTYFMQKRYPEALAVLSLNSPSLADYPQYYALLANIYMHLDQASNAVSVFQQIVVKFPNSAEYWLGLAVAYQKMGVANSAVVAYRRAAQLSEDNPQVSLFINQQLENLQNI